MWHYVDGLLIAVIVAASAGYAVYALGSVRLKRIVLTLLVRLFGVRVFSFFSPHLTGCSGCSGSDSRAELLRKLTQQK